MALSEDEWPQVLKQLTEKVRKDNLPRQIAAEKSLEEKVGRVLDNAAVRNRLLNWISRCSEVRYNKSGGTAGKLRDQGNAKFAAHDNHGALKLYTESVICAPEVGPELSLAFGNRSAALFHMGQYQEANSDIKLALKHKYPKNLEYKLHQRQGQCLIRIGLYTEALQSLEKCEAALAVGLKLTEDKKEAIIRDIAAVRTEAVTLKEAQDKQDNVCSNEKMKPYPVFSNPRLPYSNPKLSLETSNDRVRGRFVTTSADISTGEVLFSESPYSSVLLSEHYSSHCHSCYTPLLSAISCRKCSQPRYCGEECREASWTLHHQWECSSLELLHGVGVGHLAVRTLLVTGREKLEKIKKAVKAGMYEVSEGDEYSRVFNLQVHIDKLGEDELFQYVVTAGLLAIFIQKQTTFFTPKSPDQVIRNSVAGGGGKVDDSVVKYAGGLLLRHLAQLICNAHAITELVETGTDVKQVRVATAIYPSASMMNHSCKPAIINSFQGSRLVVRAVRDLKSGDEVSNCYGPHYRRHGYQERQEMLLSQYMFRCKCAACTDPKERQFLAKFSATKCDNCEGPVVDLTCGDCGESNEAFDLIDEVEADLDRMGISLLEIGQFNKAIDKLRECESKKEKRVYRHNEDLIRVRDSLARCFAELGRFDEAEILLKKTLETNCERYGSNSIEYGNELLKFTDVLTAKLNNCQLNATKSDLIVNLKKAAAIFELHWGKTSSQFKEVDAKLQKLGAL